MKTFKELSEAAVEDHYVIPPSGLSRCLKCPASVHKSVQLRADGILGQSAPSAHASEGTLMHDLADAWIKYEAGVGEQPEQDTCEQLNIYIDECLSKLCPECDHHFEHSVPLFYDDPVVGDPYWIGTDHAGEDMLFKVKPVFLNPSRYTEYLHTEDTIAVYQRAHGTLDFASYWPETKTLYIRDLKYGMLPVRSKFNLQQSAYALSLIAEYKLEVETVNIAIVQPRVEGDIEEWVLTGEELLEFCWRQFDQYLKLICLGEFTDFNPTEDSCRFCDAKAHCVAFVRPAAEALGKIPATPDLIENMPEETLSELFRDSGKIKRVLNSIETHVKARADSFDPPEFVKYTLYKARKGNKKWVDEISAKEYLEIHGVTKYTTSKMLSPTQIKKENKDLDIPLDLITQAAPKPRLVHIDEPGEICDAPVESF